MAASTLPPTDEAAATASDELFNVGDLDIDVSHGNDENGEDNSDGEDLLIASAEGSSSADDGGFQAIIDELEQLMMEETLNERVGAFMQQHCREFDESEENKLVYTTLFREYIALVEGYITERLGEAIAGFDMPSFIAQLSEKFTVLPLSLETLASMGDFEAFKEMMLSCKRGEECGVDGPFLVAGAPLQLHTDEQEDGVEMPDLNLSISSCA